MWDKASGKTRNDTPVGRPTEGLFAQSISWSPDGRHFAAFAVFPAIAVPDGPALVVIYDSADAKEAARITVPEQITTVVWHPTDPAVLFTADGWTSYWNASHHAGKTVRLWHWSDGKPVGELAGHTLAFSRDRRYLAVSRNHPVCDTSPCVTTLYEAAGLRCRPAQARNASDLRRDALGRLRARVDSCGGLQARPVAHPGRGPVPRTRRGRPLPRGCGR